jgi:hypothetical protein
MADGCVRLSQPYVTTVTDTDTETLENSDGSELKVLKADPQRE